MRQLLILSLIALCAFIPPPLKRHGTVSQASTSYNIRNFSNACSGAADDSGAFANVAVAMRANTLVQQGAGTTLTIPSGATCNLISCPTASDGTTGFTNIPNLTIIATGATIVGPGCQKWMGDLDFSLGSAVQKATNAITAGDICVTMKTPGDEANYAPFFPSSGTQLPVWVIVAGEGMQTNSFPPNYDNWEYAQVASEGGGQVCFTAPLKNSYSLSVIDLSSANCSNFYCGGPPKLVRMAGSWPSYFHVIGGTWNLVSQVEWPIQNLIIDNATFPGSSENCHLPSLNRTVTYNTVTMPNCQQEVDKEVDTITLNSSSINNMVFQSASINNLVLINGSSTITTGMPLHTTCTNSTITPFFGNTIGSLPQTFAGTNCKITGIFCCSTNQFNVPTNGFPAVSWSYLGSGAFQSTNFNLFGISPPTWASAGGRMQQGGNNGQYAAFPFTITSSTYDGVNTVTVNTTLAGASLPPQIGGDGTNGFLIDPMRNFACSGCFGSPAAIESNDSAAQNQPIFTHTNRTYTCANNTANIPNSLDINTADLAVVEGNWTSLTINVSVADTNPTDAGGSLGLVGIGWTYNTVSGTETFFNGTQADIVNLLTTGTRTVTATTVTGSQAGDTLSAPGANTFLSGNGAISGVGSIRFAGLGVTNGPAAQCPVVNVQWQTSR